MYRCGRNVPPDFIDVISILQENNKVLVRFKTVTNLMILCKTVTIRHTISIVPFT